MNDKVIEFKRELEKELQKTIYIQQALDMESQKGKAIELDGKIQALQWALDTLDTIMTR